jgi:hypothetical protein
MLSPPLKILIPPQRTFLNFLIRDLLRYFPKIKAFSGCGMNCGDWAQPRG